MKSTKRKTAAVAALTACVLIGGARAAPLVRPEPKPKPRALILAKGKVDTTSSLHWTACEKTLAEDLQGGLHAIYLKGDEALDYWYARSLDGGQTWDYKIRVTDNARFGYRPAPPELWNTCGGQIVCGPDGVLWLLTTDFEGPKRRAVYQLRLHALNIFTLFERRRRGR